MTMVRKVFTCLAAGAALMLGATSGASAAVSEVDMVFIVDESGSMGGEQAFLTSTISSLDSGLSAAGVTSRRYGLVGFGAANSQPRMLGGGFMDAGGFQTATGNLQTSGSFEDGYAGIEFTFQNFSFRPTAAVNLVLVTDEDRDTLANYASVTFNSLLSRMNGIGAKLNAIVDVTLRDGSNNRVLGVDNDGEGYLADGNGGYTTVSGSSVINGFGTTVADYANLALATQGAVWDLNQLRVGGMTAASFSAAFVDVKVQEVITTPPIVEVPAPAALPLMLAGLGIAGILRRRSAASVQAAT